MNVVTKNLIHYYHVCLIQMFCLGCTEEKWGYCKDKRISRYGTRVTSHDKFHCFLDNPTHIFFDPRIKRIKQQEKEAREAKKRGTAPAGPAGKTKKEEEEEKIKAELEAKQKEEEGKVCIHHILFQIVSTYN